MNRFLFLSFNFVNYLLGGTFFDFSFQLLFSFFVLFFGFEFLFELLDCFFGRLVFIFLSCFSGKDSNL